MLALGLGAALAAAVIFGAASIVLALAVRDSPGSSLSLDVVVTLLKNPAFALGIAMNLTGFVLHVVALRTVPLFLAQAGIAASLAVTALLAVRVFGDRLGPADWAAVAATCVGLAMLAAASGAAGDDSASATFTAGLFVAFAAVAITGFIVSRMEGVVAAGVLGLLAGCGFAGVGTAARILPSLTPGALATSGATYALLLCGGLGFLLYSVALRKGAVTAVTAPMIVSQTVVPAVVGVMLLNDDIRAGWFPIALIGFAITGWGALQLARFEQTTAPTSS